MARYFMLAVLAIFFVLSTGSRDVRAQESLCNPEEPSSLFSSGLEYYINRIDSMMENADKQAEAYQNDGFQGGGARAVKLYL